MYKTSGGGQAQLYQITHEEGRITNGKYEYNYTDHLGNLRLSFRDSLTAGAPPVITQENHYSPFGLSLKGVDFQPATPDNFKFSQNEQQNDFGINLYDFGARFSDPTTGNRFLQIDPLAEISRRFSPYIYANANPMRFIDPDGMSAQDVETYTTNDGTTVSYDVNTQKTLGYDTSTQEGGNGDEKEKNKGQTSSSTLDEKRPQLNLNDPTNHVIFFMDQRDEDDPTRLIDDVLAFFNPFKALEGLLLAKMNPFAKTNAVNHLITSIAKKYDNFKCMECADEIVETLKARGIKGEILEVVTKSNKGHSGNIWSDAANKNISINGRHKAILVEGKVYDNVNPNGLDYTKWVNDLFSPSGHTIKKTTF